MTTENYDFASNIDMAKAMSNIDCISKQIAEKEDAAICKAFSISIARLLKENGIIPIMTEHKRMLETDRERFIFKSTYGVCFNDLDMSEHDAKVRQDFAENIRSHMTKYCHARLEQQYCAMEVIDFIGKLLGEKDFSVDVEEEMKKHDAKVRADAIDEVKTLIQIRLVEYLWLENATKYGNKQANGCATVMRYEIADCVDDLLDDLEKLKEKNE